MPERAIEWGLALVSSVRASVPGRNPLALGVNVTLTVQVEVGARGAARQAVLAA